MTEIKAEDHSVAAETINNSSIDIGFSPEQYEKALRERELTLRHEYASLAVSLTSEQTEKRVAVERGLAVITDKLANIEASYAEAIEQVNYS